MVCRRVSNRSKLIQTIPALSGLSRGVRIGVRVADILAGKADGALHISDILLVARPKALSLQTE